MLGRLLLLAAVPLCAQDAPLDWNERWQNYVERTYSWKRIGMVAAETAFDQSFQLNKCGRPPYCFPSDFGAAMARRTARTTIELGMGALLHEDIRRRPSNLTGFRSRLTYALTHASLARGSDGSFHPAYSRFVGTLGGCAVTTAWNGRRISPERMAEGLGWSLAGDLQDSLLTEFGPDMKRIGLGLMHHIKR